MTEPFNIDVAKILREKNLQLKAVLREAIAEVIEHNLGSRDHRTDANKIARWEKFLSER